MIETISDWAAKFFSIVKGIWLVVLAIGGLVMALGKTIWAFVDVEGGLLALAGKIDDFSAVVQGLPSHAVMGYVNRVFPLTEYFGLLAFWYGFLLACIVIRWIRSFIPTMGG